MTEENKRPFNLPAAPEQGADLSVWVDYWVQVRLVARVRSDRKLARHAFRQIERINGLLLKPPVVASPYPHMGDSWTHSVTKGPPCDG